MTQCETSDCKTKSLPMLHRSPSCRPAVQPVCSHAALLAAPPPPARRHDSHDRRRNHLAGLREKIQQALVRGGARKPAYERLLRHRGGSFKSRPHRVRRRWHSCSVLVRQGAKGTSLVEAFPHPAFEVVLIHDALTVQRKQVVLRCANLYQLALVRVIAFWR